MAKQTIFITTAGIGEIRVTTTPADGKKSETTIPAPTGALTLVLDETVKKFEIESVAD